MNIVEAIKATTNEQPFITREKWAYYTDRPVSATTKIQPTNSPDCCVLHSWSPRTYPIPRWEPSRDDLLAEDWKPVR